MATLAAIATATSISTVAPQFLEGDMVDEECAGIDDPAYGKLARVTARLAVSPALPGRTILARRSRSDDHTTRSVGTFCSGISIIARHPGFGAEAVLGKNQIGQIEGCSGINPEYGLPVRQHAFAVDLHHPAGCRQIEAVDGQGLAAGDRDVTG